MTMRKLTPLNNLYEQLRHLPGIGSKTAMRLAYYLIDMPQEDVQKLADTLLAAKKNIKLCENCFNLSETTLCELCSDNKRDKTVICVLEQPQDILPLERSQSYNGMYHILHGALSPLDGISPDRLKLKELVRRLNDSSIQEVIIATSSSVEGEATATYIARLIKPLGVTVSRIAQGLPIGTNLEYVDELTLFKAIENRRIL